MVPSSKDDSDEDQSKKRDDSTLLPVSIWNSRAYLVLQKITLESIEWMRIYTLELYINGSPRSFSFDEVFDSAERETQPSEKH
jgi:hypothetical protein